MSTYSEFREQKRADKEVDREQDRADQVARHQARLQERRVRERLRLQAVAAAAEQARLDKDAARAAWKARWDAFKAWMRRDSLMTPVIATSVLLSWTGMAMFGTWVYGLLGFLLPLFSEGLFVAFAARITGAVNKGEPVGWLRVGLVFSGVCTAGMQTIHGLAGPGGSWHRAVVMAVVSVAGVIAHQIITAGPRVKLTAFEQMQARIARAARRREHRMQMAAVRQAVAELGEDGTARLVHRGGLVTLTRSGLLRRLRLVEAVPVVPETTAAAAPEPVVPAVDPAGSGLGDEAEAWLAAQTAPGGSHLGGTAETAGTGEDAADGSEPVGNQPGNRPQPSNGNRSASGSGTTETDLIERARQAQRSGDLPTDPSRRDVQKVLRVRASVAGRIAKALKDYRDDGGVMARL